MNDSAALAARIKSLAHELGFQLVGITRPAASQYADAYHAWIAAGKHGEMKYLERNIDEHLDITKRYPWAKSVLCVGLAYYQEVPRDIAADEGKIARYAWGRDYHKVIPRKLEQLEKQIREIVPALQARICCDTAPVMERELAMNAGLGWVGKHTLLIHPRHGSWFLLGEMILDLDLPADTLETDHCGTCRRCIEACPTDAITPYSVDATKCISYLTLEHRGEIGEDFQPAMSEAGFVVGCDICQEVCPFNRDPLRMEEPDFAPRPIAPSVPLADILRWNDQEWDILTRGMALRRAKFEMWQRNAAVLVQNKKPL